VDFLRRQVADLTLLQKYTAELTEIEYPDDPTADYLEPSLQGYRLRERNYESIPSRLLPDGTMVVTSEVLGLEFHLVENKLQLVIPNSGQILPPYQEIREAYSAALQPQRQAETAQRQAGARVQQEKEKREALEVRLAELEARLRQEGKNE
jgi:hypothetical protein